MEQSEAVRRSSRERRPTGRFAGFVTPRARRTVNAESNPQPANVEANNPQPVDVNQDEQTVALDGPTPIVQVNPVDNSLDDLPSPRSRSPSPRSRAEVPSPGTIPGIDRRRSRSRSRSRSPLPSNRSRTHFDWLAELEEDGTPLATQILDSFQAFLHQRSEAPDNNETFRVFINEFCQTYPSLLLNQTEYAFRRSFREGYRNWTSQLFGNRTRRSWNCFASRPEISSKVKEILTKIRRQTALLMFGNEADPSQEGGGRHSPAPVPVAPNAPTLELQNGGSQTRPTHGRAAPTQEPHPHPQAPTPTPASRRGSQLAGREARDASRTATFGVRNRLPSNRAEDEQALHEHMVGNR